MTIEKNDIISLESICDVVSHTVRVINACRILQNINTCRMYMYKKWQTDNI